MERVKNVVRVIPAGQWADSSVHEPPEDMSSPPSERIRAARAFYRKVYWWMSGGRDMPRRMENVVRVFRHER